MPLPCYVENKCALREHTLNLWERSICWLVIVSVDTLKRSWDTFFLAHYMHCRYFINFKITINYKPRTGFLFLRFCVYIDSIFVRPSVCLSVCHTGFTRKRLNRFSRNLVRICGLRAPLYAANMRNGSVIFFTEYGHAISNERARIALSETGLIPDIE